jgi:hypothetical protein
MNSPNQRSPQSSETIGGKQINTDQNETKSDFRPIR